MKKIIKSILLLVAVLSLCTSCDDFVFGNVHVDYNDNPLAAKGVAHSGADRYVDSLSKVKVFYSGVEKAQLWRMLTHPQDYFTQYRQNIVLM